MAEINGYLLTKEELYACTELIKKMRREKEEEEKKRRKKKYFRVSSIIVDYYCAEDKDEAIDKFYEDMDMGFYDSSDFLTVEEISKEEFDDCYGDENW